MLWAAFTSLTLLAAPLAAPLEQSGCTTYVTPASSDITLTVQPDQTVRLTGPAEITIERRIGIDYVYVQMSRTATPWSDITGSFAPSAANFITNSDETDSSFEVCSAPAPTSTPVPAPTSTPVPGGPGLPGSTSAAIGSMTDLFRQLFGLLSGLLFPDSPTALSVVGVFGLLMPLLVAVLAFLKRMARGQ